MVDESREIKRLIRKYCTVEAKNDGGLEYPDGYFAVCVGKAPKAVSQSVYDPVDFSVETERVEEELHARIRAARADRWKVVYLRPYPRKSTSYAESVRLDDTEDTEAAAEEDPKSPGAAWGMVHQTQSNTLVGLVDRYVGRVEELHQTHRDEVMFLLQRCVKTELDNAELRVRLELQQRPDHAAMLREMRPIVEPLVKTASETASRAFMLWVATQGRRGDPDALRNALGTPGGDAQAPPTVTVMDRINAVRELVVGLLTEAAAPTTDASVRGTILDAARQLHAALSQALSAFDAAAGAA